MNFHKRHFAFLALFFVVLLTQAQELEPRLMSAVPTGGRFFIASYAHTQGNILLNNALPLKDLKTKMNNFVLAYAGSFKLFNKLAKFDVIVPYAFAEFNGKVNNVDSTGFKNGFGDSYARLSVILIGDKPVPISQYGKVVPKKFSLGVYSRLSIPMGQYDPTKFLNLGTNRWAGKFGLVGSQSVTRKLIFELHLLGWVFGDNKNFFNGNVVSQSPMFMAQLHTIYIFKPGIWTSISFGKSNWGTTQVNGVEQNNKQDNSNFGASFSYRVAKNHSLKVAYTSGLSTRYGADFDTFILAYSFLWFKKK